MTIVEDHNRWHVVDEHGLVRQSCSSYLLACVALARLQAERRCGRHRR